MLYIDAVKKESNYVDYLHRNIDTITHVWWTYNLQEESEKFCTKAELINFIKKQGYGCAKTKYKQDGTWHEGRCICVLDGKYLRTDPNAIREDNLSKLPVK